MHSLRVSRSSTSLSWRRGCLLGPGCSENHEIPQLQSIDRCRRHCWAGPADSTCAVCVKTVETPQLHASYSFLDKVADMPVVFNDKMPVFERAENCEGPAVAALFLGGRCPCCAGRVGAAGAFCGCERPCDHTATCLCLFNSLVPQIQFTARVVDILLYNRDWYAAFIRGVMAAVNGFLTHFASFFALLRLSRS